MINQFIRLLVVHWVPHSFFRFQRLPLVPDGLLWFFRFLRFCRLPVVLVTTLVPPVCQVAGGTLHSPKVPQVPKVAVGSLWVSLIEVPCCSYVFRFQRLLLVPCGFL